MRTPHKQFEPMTSVGSNSTNKQKRPRGEAPSDILTKDIKTVQTNKYHLQKFDCAGGRCKVSY